MIERIEDNSSPYRRWESLIRYRNAQKEAPKTGSDSGEKTASTQGNKRPETTVSRQSNVKNYQSGGKVRRRSGGGECQACKNRRASAQTDSDDSDSTSINVTVNSDTSSAGETASSTSGEETSSLESVAQLLTESSTEGETQIEIGVCPQCGRSYINCGGTSITSEGASMLSEYLEQTSHFDLHV